MVAQITYRRWYSYTIPLKYTVIYKIVKTPSQAVTPMVDGSEYMPDLHIAENNEDKNV